TTASVSPPARCVRDRYVVDQVLAAVEQRMEGQMVKRTVRNDDQVPRSKPIAHRRNQIVVQLAQMGEGGPVGRASVRRPVIRRESRELELQQREMTPESPGARQVDDVEPVATEHRNEERAASLVIFEQERTAWNRCLDCLHVELRTQERRRPGIGFADL